MRSGFKVTSLLYFCFVLFDVMVVVVVVAFVSFVKVSAGLWAVFCHVEPKCGALALEPIGNI